MCVVVFKGIKKHVSEEELFKSLETVKLDKKSYEQMIEMFESKSDIEKLI